MSYALQNGQIRGVLVAQGFPADLATQLANILANGAQQMRLSGERIIDTTRPGMRMITPGARTHQFKNLDFLPADPDHRERRVPSSEERRRPAPEPAVQTEQSPAETLATFRVEGGAYTEARGLGDSVQVNLRTSGPGRMPVFDPPSNSLVGKTFRAESNSDTLRLDIVENGQEVVWRAQVAQAAPRGGNNDAAITVVTGLKWVQDKGLEVTTRQITVLRAENESATFIIPATPVTVVKAVRDAGDIVIDKQEVLVFQDKSVGSDTIATTTC
jgi:hypothetical protein